MENKIENWCCYSDLPSPSAYKDMNDDLETYLEEFELAQTSSAKSILVEKIELYSDDDELITELKNQVNDLKEIESIEEDSQINLDIDSGKYELFTCLKSLYLVGVNFQKGNNYYVRVDDVVTEYKMTGIFDDSTLKEYFSSIKPIYYVITDQGIGTRKNKNIFPKDIDFSDFFTKFA